MLVRPFAVDRKWGAEPPAPDSGLTQLTAFAWLLLNGLFLCSQPFFDQNINICLEVRDSIKACCLWLMVGIARDSPMEMSGLVTTLASLRQARQVPEPFVLRLFHCDL